MLLGLAVVKTASLLLLRYGLHKTAMLDGELGMIFAQMRLTIQAQHGPATSPFLALLDVPEFRIGLLLTSLLMFTIGYLLLTTLGGAFAGILRRGNAPANLTGRP